MLALAEHHKLSGRAMLDAMVLGIAASQPVGLREQFGTMTKPLHPGGPARVGLMSALMAKYGHTAQPHEAKREDAQPQQERRHLVPRARRLRTKAQLSSATNRGTGATTRMPGQRSQLSK